LCGGFQKRGKVLSDYQLKIETPPDFRPKRAGLRELLIVFDLFVIMSSKSRTDPNIIFSPVIGGRFFFRVGGPVTAGLS
jgi:hypothetical protein